MEWEIDRMSQETALLSLVVSTRQRTMLRHFVADTNQSLSEIARRGIASVLNNESPELANAWLRASPAERGKKTTLAA
jgi:hypothetical protein